ncbi:MAG: secondary thiamine-phosphate synthase enzyme YjbQ [Desulfobacteraceae bacterium]|jgi:secondary thiamine-phosphate synthase enzyme
MLLSVQSNSRTEFIDVTQKLQAMVAQTGVKSGLCLLFVPHTTAAVTINENADPSVPVDILKILNQVVPWQADYRHLEGNSAAHIKSTLVGASQTVAIAEGRLVLGTWQAVFFCEFDGPRRRKLHVRIWEGAFTE